MAELPESVWQGSFTVFGVQVKCHVLSDGRRIIEAESMKNLLDAMYSGDVANNASMDEFARWLKGLS